MKSNDTSSFLNATAESAIIPVFYHPDKQLSLDVVGACYEAGLRVFEFTNRGEKALEVFEYILNNTESFPEMKIGIGTIMQKSQAITFTEMGAHFIVSPIVDQDTAEYCVNKNIPWIPGCGTLTEIITATRMEADLVKIFPGNTLGPGFVSSVLGPCPDLHLMPTGGVEPTIENLTDWFTAGVHCVGMGSKLITKSILENRDFGVLKDRIRSALSIIEKVKADKK